jgi:hypothetical protein
MQLLRFELDEGMHAIEHPLKRPTATEPRAMLGYNSRLKYAPNEANELISQETSPRRSES